MKSSTLKYVKAIFLILGINIPCFCLLFDDCLFFFIWFCGLWTVFLLFSC